jgi:hypothetical protein
VEGEKKRRAGWGTQERCTYPRTAWRAARVKFITSCARTSPAKAR